MCQSTWCKSITRNKLQDIRCPGTHPEVVENAFTIRNMFYRINHKGLIINGNIIHGSHQLAWRRGILFCMQCGVYTNKRVGNLAHQCLMKVPSSTTRRILNQLIDGSKSPLVGGQWPQESDQPPLHILSRTGSSLNILRD